MSLKKKADPEIIEKAAEMMNAFLQTGGNASKASHWKNTYKAEVMMLLWQLHYQRDPMPVDLVMLVGCLFGDRQDWPVTKFAAISYMADHYPPPKSGENLPKGAQTAVAKIIEEYGGIHKTKRNLDSSKGSESRDFRSTARGWLNEPLFKYLWDRRYQQRRFRRDHDAAERVEVARNAIKKLTNN